MTPQKQKWLKNQWWLRFYLTVKPSHQWSSTSEFSQLPVWPKCTHSGPKEVKAGQWVPLAHGCYELSHLESKALLTGEILSLLKQMWEGCKRRPPTQIYRYYLEDVRIKDDQLNMTQPLPRKTNKVPMWVCVLSHSVSCIWLCDLTDCSHPGSSAHGIFFQARMLEWVIAISGHLLDPRVEAVSAESPVLQADSLLSCQGSPKSPIIGLKTWKSMKCLTKNWEQSS